MHPLIALWAGGVIAVALLTVVAATATATRRGRTPVIAAAWACFALAWPTTVPAAAWAQRRRARQRAAAARRAARRRNAR